MWLRPRASCSGALGPEGTAVLNGDDPSVRGQARSFKGNVTYYGLDVANDLVASGIAVDFEGRPSFNVCYDQEQVAVKLVVPGGCIMCGTPAPPLRWACTLAYPLRWGGQGVRTPYAQRHAPGSSAQPSGGSSDSQ